MKIYKQEKRYKAMEGKQNRKEEMERVFYAVIGELRK